MRPILSDTLSVLLPTEQDTLLLRACMCSGDAGREAWCAWLERIGEPREEMTRRRPILSHFLPLLHVATKRYSADVQPDLAFYLRAACFREELRSRTYRGILQSVLRSLRDAGIDLTVLKGAALAGTVYDDRALRHCHDIDLLVDETDLASASRALQNAGLGQPCEPSRMSRDVRFAHDSGLPIELHADLFRLPCHQSGRSAMVERRQRREVAGLSVHVLSPADMLLHVCGHASCSESRASLRWVADAWSIAMKCADLDWDAFLGGAARTKLALSLYVMLTYLATHLDAPIPKPVLCSLAREANHVGRTAREAALFGVCGSHHGFRNATRNWRSRAFLLRWRLLPSPSYLRWAYDVRSGGGVLRLYFERMARYVARRARLVGARSGPVRNMKQPPLGDSEMSSGTSTGTRRMWMPSDRQVLLVRAALLGRKPAIDAWNRWKLAGDFERIDDGSSALLPIVYRNLVDHGVSDLVVKRARLAYKMTWLGNERLFTGVSALLRSLRAAGIETMILKGAAIALLYYRDLGLRSMGDVDILIRPHDVANAIETLTELGWKKMGRTPHVLTETYLNARRAINFSSDRIAKLDLHWHVMEECCRPNGDEPFWSGAIRTTVRGVETLAMNPTDQLLHICAHEARWTPVPLPRWIVDVMMILGASGGEIDWDRFVSHTQRFGLVSPVREVLEQVVEVVDAPIPSSVLCDLRGLPLSKEDVREYRIRCRPPNPLRILRTDFRRMSLQPGRHSTRWRILTFPSYARVVWGLDHAWQLPFHALLWEARALKRFVSYRVRKLARRTLHPF